MKKRIAKKAAKRFLDGKPIRNCGGYILRDVSDLYGEALPVKIEFLSERMHRAVWDETRRRAKSWWELHWADQPWLVANVWGPELPAWAPPVRW